MQETNFYKLRKPDEADFINVEDLNYNADVLDRELNNLKNKSFEIVNSLSDSSTDKALAAAQGKWLNENKLTNKKRVLSAAELNNPNYPEPYVCSTDKGKEIGLPTSQAYIQYFRNENDDGFGTQIAYKLDRANQEGDNSKLWTMKIRVASALMWGAWENVATSIPKGHYAVTDLNTCQEDGNHYYFVSSTANKPPLHSDGIVSVYAYNAGNNEQQSFAPYIVQVAHSWWQESIFMRSGKNGAFSNWKEVLTSNNAAFSVDDAGLHMKKPLFFTATDGSSHTLQELFQSASEGKTKVANALTGIGMPTSTTASWPEIANNIVLSRNNSLWVSSKLASSPNDVVIKGSGNVEFRNTFIFLIGSPYENGSGVTFILKKEIDVTLAKKVILLADGLQGFSLKNDINNPTHSIVFNGNNILDVSSASGIYYLSYYDYKYYNYDYDTGTTTDKRFYSPTIQGLVVL